MASTNASGVVQDQGEQPIDAVTPQRRAGRAVGQERLPLLLEDRSHRVGLTTDRAVNPLLRRAWHSSVPLIVWRTRI